MCGIGLVLSGILVRCADCELKRDLASGDVGIDSDGTGPSDGDNLGCKSWDKCQWSAYPQNSAQNEARNDSSVFPSTPELGEALHRRGPDSLTTYSFQICLPQNSTARTPSLFPDVYHPLSPSAACTSSFQMASHDQNTSAARDNVAPAATWPVLTDARYQQLAEIRDPATADYSTGMPAGMHGPAGGMPAGHLDFLGASLQLRGTSTVRQPLQDAAGNVLIFSGEIFGGLPVLPEENDAQVLLCHLAAASGSISGVEDALSDQSVPQILSRIRGPWAVIFWQSASSTIWYGRDVIGRKSLLLHRPTPHDPRFLLSSLHPQKDATSSVPPPLETATSAFDYWADVPCGIFSLVLSAPTAQPPPLPSPPPPLVGWHSSHAWEDTRLSSLATWRRAVPPAEEDREWEPPQAPGGGLDDVAVEGLLAVLTSAVKRRVENVRAGGGPNQSGGATSAGSGDVAVLFSGGLDSMLLAALADRHMAPDVPISLFNVSFVGPSAPDRQTAIRGLQELRQLAPNRRWRLVEVDATVSQLEDHKERILSLICPSATYMDLNIGAALWFAAGGGGGGGGVGGGARVLLVGMGADEQCGGYARYRTRFKAGGWHALQEEMRMDVRRLWSRNLGRDDRCIADNGKEARFPFLDEEVMWHLLSLPLEAVVDLRLPAGRGDKMILREFGSRIAQQTNTREFGSNRAANQAAAGGRTLGGLNSREGGGKE